MTPFITLISIVIHFSFPRLISSSISRRELSSFLAARIRRLDSGMIYEWMHARLAHKSLWHDWQLRPLRFWKCFGQSKQVWSISTIIIILWGCTTLESESTKRTQSEKWRRQHQQNYDVGWRRTWRQGNLRNPRREAWVLISKHFQVFLAPARKQISAHPKSRFTAAEAAQTELLKIIIESLVEATWKHKQWTRRKKINDFSSSQRGSRNVLSKVNIFIFVPERYANEFFQYFMGHVRCWCLSNLFSGESTDRLWMTFQQASEKNSKHDPWLSFRSTPPLSSNFISSSSLFKFE